MSSHTHDVYASYSRYVTANNVVVRKKASNKGKIVGSYKKAANITTDTYTRYVTASSLTIRKKASTSAAKAGSYKKGTQITCYGERS